MAFCNTIHHRGSAEIVVKHFPAHLLHYANKSVQDVGRTIVSVPNCLGDTNNFESKWEAKMQFVGEKKMIIMTLQFMETYFPELITVYGRYTFTASVQLLGHVINVKEYTVIGSSIPEYRTPKIVFHYQLTLVNNKRFSNGPTIPIKYLKSNNEDNQLKLDLSVTLTMIFDWGRTPFTPLWCYGKEPFTLTIYTTDGWIKTDKAIVTAKCKYIWDRLAEAGIPTEEPGVVCLLEASFLGLQHIVAYIYNGQFVTPNWVRDLSLIVQACGVLQLDTLKTHCHNLMLYGGPRVPATS